ncbi:MAG TPA: PPC domain-containing protein, partial [Pirellulaceae bacterium]|nr:PPC domain-containing protein [Pirellulaceae bacterium]
SVEVELIGPNIGPGVRRRLAPPADGAFSVIHVGEAVNYGVASEAELSQRNSLENAAFKNAALANASLANASIVGDVSAAIGDWPERVEREATVAAVKSTADANGAGSTNDSRDTAEPVEWPVTVNGRFQRAGDEDWYRVTLAEKQRVWIETIAHRFVRSPVDTSLQVFDSQGALVAENDDDATIDPGYESIHDFKTTDSRILLTAPKSGDYWIRVGEQSGNHGPRAVYRLSIHEAVPDFQLRHFPDAVPVWGPGSTAAVLVKIDRLAGCNDEIELTIEGLDPKWRSSKTVSLGTTPERPLNQYQSKMFLTVTAPDDAPLGSTAEFRIVGRMKRDGRTIERRSWPITLFYTSDTGFFRVSPAARVAVAKSQGPWLEAITTEITTTPGGKTTIPVRVRGAEGLKEMPLVVNLIAAGVGCGITTPQNLPIVDGRVDVPLTLPPEIPPGEFGIVVAQTWRSDIRVGMPGPCTPLIKLRVMK